MRGVGSENSPLWATQHNTAYFGDWPTESCQCEDKEIRPHIDQTSGSQRGKSAAWLPRGRPRQHFKDFSWGVTSRAYDTAAWWCLSTAALLYHGNKGSSFVDGQLKANLICLESIPILSRLCFQVFLNIRLTAWLVAILLPRIVSCCST